MKEETNILTLSEAIKILEEFKESFVKIYEQSYYNKQVKERSKRRKEAIEIILKELRNRL